MATKARNRLDESESVPAPAELGYRVCRAGNRLSRHVEHPVDVEQNARHGA